MVKPPFKCFYQLNADCRLTIVKPVHFLSYHMGRVAIVFKFINEQYSILHLTWLNIKL